MTCRDDMATDNKTNKQRCGDAVMMEGVITICSRVYVAIKAIPKTFALA